MSFTVGPPAAEYVGCCRTIPAEAAERDVFALLASHYDPGEIADAIEQLPKEIKALWPQAARTFKSRAS